MMTSKESIAQISRLNASAKSPSSRKQIAKGLDNAAERSGMSIDDLQEVSVPTYGFTEIGRYVQQFGDYRAEISITGPNSAKIVWTGANGKELSAAPAAVKQEHSERVKALKKMSVDIEAILPSIRYRIESSLLQQRHWNYKSWRERYLDHPICAAFARRLIWNINGKAGIWSEEQIVDVKGVPLEFDPDHSLVELWHPIAEPAANVLEWRQWLQAHHVTQPFKQAHREIYVLTDAERQTGTYSNRFAAHIIRQHQFAELCKQRGWSYTLQGQWDSFNTPELQLPRWNLKVEFHVEPAGEGVTPAFVYLQLATDQVRFSRLNTREPLNLTEIMPIVFTEVMRDVDLFVGVCSIGNDPNWQDGGTHHDYWYRQSFGDLGVTAETRREALQAIIPRTKIASRCSFSDKFITVKGDLRTYNIHLGSGNILMEPNGQYLCIVQTRGDMRLTGSDQIYLPFEGDNILSVILSKCFLLANDSKIKDLSILNQINRK